MRKKEIAILLCVSLLLAGCGDKKSEPTENASMEVVTEAEASSEEVVESPVEFDVTDEITEPNGEIASESDFYGEVENGVYVLWNCTSQADVIEVPAEINGAPVGGIAANAFYNLPCKRIVLPDTVTAIGDYAFFFCQSLEEIELGSGLKNVGAQIFANCASLKTVTFPEGTESIHCPFFMNDELVDVYIPASVTEILEGIGSPKTCPKMVVVTPSGSVAEAQALEEGYPVRNE